MSSAVVIQPLSPRADEAGAQPAVYTVRSRNNSVFGSNLRQGPMSDPQVVNLTEIALHSTPTFERFPKHARCPRQM